MKAYVVVLTILPAAVGCAGYLTQTPPVEKQFEKSRVFDLNYDSTWSRAVDWFASHNVVIDKIQKESGLITARYQVHLWEGTMDHGAIQKHGSGTEDPTYEYQASLNMLVTSEERGKTKVAVNVFGTFRATTYWGLLARNGPVILDGKCVSTGVLEQSVFDFIASGK